MHDKLIIRGARENNLKNITLEIPRDKLVVLTGISGSGKSSLAFDTIYAEGQRRYVESLSSYARQFLGQKEKPDVDGIDGLSPAISIDQKTTSRNPRSTVGTVTEIYDYLRLLWARIGVPHCPECGKEIRHQSIDQIIDQITELPEATRIQILAPVVRGRKGEYQKVFEDARKSGYVRVRVDGSLYDLSEEIKLDKNKKHNIEIIIDRLVIREDIARRLTDSVETAAALSGGIVIVDIVGEERELMFSQNYACEDCGISMEELTPRLFSFNNPAGACPECMGLGTQLRVDPDIIIPNKSLSILEGAISASGWGNVKKDGVAKMYFEALAKKYKFTLGTPIKNLPKSVFDILMYGTGGEKLTLYYDQPRGKGTFSQPFEGIIPNLERRYKDTQSQGMRWELEQYMSEHPCPTCGGKKLKKEVIGVTVGELSIVELTDMSIVQALEFIEGLKLSEKDAMIADRILREIRERLGFLRSVGLEYLTLARQAGSLSGGESQRIRLATQIGSSLMGVLYILDEPSIGLHQRDNVKLLATLKRLRDLGNTLLVVEHDEETIAEADYIVDIGPGAGIHGGEVVCAGTIDEISSCENSETGLYLSGRKKIPVPEERRKGTGKVLRVVGARENNLKNISVDIPLGVMTCVTGVSGSGKSSLLNEVVYKSLASALNRAKIRHGERGEIIGMEHLDKVIDVDQSPIGRTPRS
ncbi:MAG: excinuclease ABC subunit UvrA, partial [Clostridiales bacterium]|nr:excinuclease ABC subunit UvrA [Clostridiales bacterium]